MRRRPRHRRSGRRHRRRPWAFAPGFSGTQAGFDSSNGFVGLDGRWDKTELTTSNGLVRVSGDHASVNAETSNGEIVASLETRRSVEASLSNSNGMVAVELRRSAAPGFDLYADSSNGNVVIHD